MDGREGRVITVKRRSMWPTIGVELQPRAVTVYLLVTFITVRW